MVKTRSEAYGTPDGAKCYGEKQSMDREWMEMGINPEGGQTARRKFYLKETANTRKERTKCGRSLCSVAITELVRESGGR